MDLSVDATDGTVERGTPEKLRIVRDLHGDHVQFESQEGRERVLFERAKSTEFVSR